MKKFFSSSVIILLTLSLCAQPAQKQPGPPKPAPVTERWKRDSIKLQLYVTITENQMRDVKNSFVSFYKDLDALVTNAQGTPPKREEVGRIIKNRNDFLNRTFNKMQADRFETFEKEFMPPPPHQGDHPNDPPQ